MNAINSNSNHFLEYEYFDVVRSCDRGKYDRVYKHGARIPSLGHCKCFDASAEGSRESLQVMSRGSIPCEMHCKRFILAAVLNALRG